ncbi:MAG TPA: hypothetical protein V6D08_15065 [Candidatus Obscuribacterales bacterium]
MSTLKKPDPGRITAEHTVGELFGDVEIYEQPARQALEQLPPISETLNEAPYGSRVKLNVQITNVAEVPEPIQSLNDVQALGSGIGQGLLHVGQETLNYLATPGAVENGLLEIGPALDNAVNYYANTPAEQVRQDAQEALGFIWQGLEDSLGHPLKAQERGERAGEMMAAFIPIGANKVLNERELVALGGAEKLERMTQQELEALGLRRFEMPRLKLERDEFSIRASIPGDDKAWVRAEIPSPGVVNITSLHKGALPEGLGGQFLAEALKGHNAIPTERLILRDVLNPETLAAYKAGVAPADTLLGKCATKALKQLGMTPTSYKFEAVQGKLNLVIETQ